MIITSLINNNTIPLLFTLHWQFKKNIFLDSNYRLVNPKPSDRADKITISIYRSTKQTKSYFITFSLR